MRSIFSAILDRMRRDHGLALLILTLVLVAIVYGPTLQYGLVNYDDSWLVGDNFVLKRFSWSTIGTVLFDTSSTTRFLLGAEYLPVRDLSVAMDYGIWGSWYPGHHLTNLLLYLAAVRVWFGVLVGWGLDRRLVALTILFWALHPTHAESVAWLSERKGLLGLLWAGVVGICYVRFRSGRHTAWLLLAVIAAVLAVWSKALSAFTIASFAGLEIVLPEKRISWSRSLSGLVAIAAASGLAFVPVLKTAQQLAVVSGDAHAPADAFAMVIGGHGFYLEQAALFFRNAISYPISTLGPSTFQLVLGAVSLVAATSAALVPARGWWKPPPSIRAGAWIWLLSWFPVSRLLLPLRVVLFADRYALVWTLGFTLIVATGLLRLKANRARTALIATIVGAMSLRTFDAQSNWRSSVTLWQRAVVSNGTDGDAWSSYAEALETSGQSELAVDVVARGLRRSRSPRLLLRKALLVLERGQRATALKAMQQAADAGEPRAISNMSYLLLQDGHREEALTWGRRAVAAAPMNSKAYSNLGAAALSLAHFDEAHAAFLNAYELWPFSLANRYNLAVALVGLGRVTEARVHLNACISDPAVGLKAQQLLDQISR